MCYSTSNREKTQAQMEREMEATFRDPTLYDPYYWMNGFSHGKIYGMTQEAPDKIDVMTWGIVEPWTKDVKERWKKLAGKSLNTQSEYAFDNNRSEEAILKRRVVLPVTGYFEPYHIKKESFPHLVQPIHESYFGLLGVYNVIDGIRYTSILTTEANRFMQQVHNSKKRQPIMLDPYHWKDWVDPNLNDSLIRQLMFQCDTDQEIEAFTVSKSATNSRADNNVPEILERKHFPEVIAQQKYDVQQMDTYNENLDNLNSGFESTSLFG
ncbi:SOS response-associated peptidase [Flagellimonas hymeniacidonis]|uniref:Abasic site processing protein n=1 Tax=Flagellimonas hymeniacidonis TaxID=2603628 RepID=A0A5C8V7M6_9FLAO|nr:SOS response-associated peptidase family protein [Flagellimonas hymeniacidonis]TXN37721.1 SOS response-associated peptidase [Flagellimonas hymeniacidonis]